MTTTVVNLKKGYGTVGPKADYKDAKAWVDASPDHVYVGRTTRIGMPRAVGGVYVLRQSPFHNPYTVKAHQNEDPAELFKQMLETNERLRNMAVSQLRGKVLGCWCLGIRKCHAQVLADYVNAQEDQGLQN
jgi:hypothetical protein